MIAALLQADEAAVAPVVATERLLWVGPLTVCTSIAAVLAVRLVAIRIPGVRTGSVTVGWTAPAVDTAILCTVAVVVFAGICAFHDQPLRQFQRVAFGALLASFLPLLIIAKGGLGGNGPTAVALAAMHLAAYVPCVTVMPRLVAIHADRRSESAA
jgi:hypothetical protein